MANWLANTIDKIGTMLNMDEYGISERLAGNTPTVNTGYTPQSQAAGLDTWRDYHFSSPVPTQAPAPTNTGSSGGGYTSPVASVNNSPTNNNQNQISSSNDGGRSFNQGPSQQEIDNAFNPLFANLDNQQTQNKSFYDTEKLGLQETQTSQIGRLGEQRTSTFENMDLEKTDYDNQVESALNQAVRAYKALAQRARGYGGGNSASRAMGELASKEFARQQGSINQTSLGQTAKYQKAVKDTELFFINTETDIKSNHQKALKDLMNSYMAEENKISMMRNETESAKRQYRLEVKQQVSNLENQLLASWRQQEDSLKVWKQQQDYMLTQELQATASNVYNTPDQLFNDAQTKLDIGTQPVAGNDQTAMMMRRVGNREEDEFNSFWA